MIAMIPVGVLCIFLLCIACGFIRVLYNFYGMLVDSGIALYLMY